jgi:hypothetical protein
MCYVISDYGLVLLRANHRIDPSAEATVREPAGTRTGDDQRLRKARHDVHVAGWVLALTRGQRDLRYALRGREQAVLCPPTRSTPAGRAAMTPVDLRLPGGCVAHDFLRADGAGAEVG